VYYFYVYVSGDCVTCKWRYTPFVTLILNNNCSSDTYCLGPTTYDFSVVQVMSCFIYCLLETYEAAVDIYALSHY